MAQRPLSYSVNLSGSADDASAGAIRRAFGAFVRALFEAGVTVSGALTGSAAAIRDPDTGELIPADTMHVLADQVGTEEEAKTAYREAEKSVKAQEQATARAAREATAAVPAGRGAGKQKADAAKAAKKAETERQAEQKRLDEEEHQRRVDAEAEAILTRVDATVTTGTVTTNG